MKNWTLKELLIALKMFDESDTHQTIADKLNRTSRSVKNKLRKHINRFILKKEVVCKNTGCNELISVTNKNKRKFCSRSCSTSYNNKLYKKRHKTKTCKVESCNKKIYSNYVYCELCSKKRINKLKNRTLSECIYENHHRSSAFALVRSLARTIAKNNNMVSCIICGYDKHVEIDHIKPISDFPLKSKLSEINHVSNLRPLCRNHHWEIRNGLIT